LGWFRSVLGFAQIIKALPSSAESNNPVWIILALQVLVAEAGASEADDGDSESSGLLSFRFHPPRHVQPLLLCTLCRLGIRREEEDESNRRRPNAKRQVVIALRAWMRPRSSIRKKKQVVCVWQEQPNKACSGCT